MYRLSCERCVCFVLLVILAFLSCSGFRIDNLAMTDISRKNAQDAAAQRSPSEEWIARLRLRHLSHSNGGNATTNNHRVPRARIDAYVVPPPAKLAQLRLRRRDAGRRRSEQQRLEHREDQLLRKARRALVVLLARVESRSDIRRKVVFRVEEQFKNSSALPVHDRVGVTLANAAAFRPRHQYVLFLNASGASAAPPERVRPRFPQRHHLDALRRVCHPSFKPSPTKIVKLKLRRKSVRCVARGFPPPRITWRRDIEVLHNSTDFVITTPSPRAPHQHERRLRMRRRIDVVSELKVKNDAHLRDIFRCEAKGAFDDKPVTREVQYKFSDVKVRCNETERAFCTNGGECYKEKELGIYYCECPSHTSGERCEQKKPQIPRMYSEKDDICKLGMATKYFCTKSR